MTPGARVQAAIEVLDRVLAGEAAERALTVWARGSRYAGSKDRAAVRDHVFDGLRQLRSGAWIGGIPGDPQEGDARRVLTGVLSGQGAHLGTLFSGEGHAPAPLTAFAPRDVASAPKAVSLDVPDWLHAIIQADLGPAAPAALAALRQRAPVFLRTNTARISRDALLSRLTEEGVAAQADGTAPTAIRLDAPRRGLTNLSTFQEGLWELQDAGSQALISRLPEVRGLRVLDLCAGGGGKALAIAARGAEVFAHDADPARMRDLPIRAARAGVDIRQIETPDDATPFDAVVADVPCSGSGSWRRTPDAKWRLTPDRLTELTQVQTDILNRALRLVRPGGWVAYMTCSIIARENGDRVDDMLADTSGVQLEDRWSSLPTPDGCDGFHLSVLRRD